MQIQPIKDWVIVLKSIPEKERNGIIVPDTAKRKSVDGKVTAIGKDVKDVKVGDTVLTGSIVGMNSEINIDGNDIIRIREKDIMAIIEEEG